MLMSLHQWFNMQCVCHACVFFRLVMYMERDLRKATPLKENPSQSAHLSQCLDLLIVYLSTTPAVVLGKHKHTLLPRRPAWKFS